MEQLDHVSGTVHERVVDLVLDENRTHRDDAIGQALGSCDDVRCHAEARGAERFAETAKRGNHLIEDQQDAMRVADLAQTLEVTDGRRNNTGRTDDRLYSQPVGC